MMDILKGFAGFTALPQQQPVPQLGPQHTMPVITHTYASYTMGPPQVSYSISELNLPHLFTLV